MNKKNVVVAVVALALLLSALPSMGQGIATRGDCHPARSSGIAPGCSWCHFAIYCPDDCNDLRWTNGACVGHTGLCNEFTQSVPDEICSECGCYDEISCVNYGSYTTGSVLIVNCSNG